MRNWYRIKHHTQEAFCDQCGEPLRVGDEALEGKRGVYCCEPCRDEAEAHNDGLQELGRHLEDCDYGA